ncbi:hypothetical protein KDAU_40330 [Dictyobacter aurantiacus]|uniref:Uncharacterized protein n=1 Tax=Dictyobacter aurantiacus TaxID=1936993 RepID=A0A401ZIP5_9CHLR|nr:hypothetical protein KDAU_40330 [Dictyobacter aurantiacus]
MQGRRLVESPQYGIGQRRRGGWRRAVSQGRHQTTDVFNLSYILLAMRAGTYMQFNTGSHVLAEFGGNVITQKGIGLLMG